MMKGVKHFKAGRNDPAEYQKAIDAFKAAREINPIPDATYNIARSYHMMNNCEMALATYKEYATTSVENAESVKDFIAELTEQCGNNAGTLKMRCTPANAMVSIDGEAPTQCVAEQTIPTGDHKLVISADGYNSQTRNVSVTTKSQSTEIIVELQKSQQAQAPKQQAPKTEQASKPAETSSVTDWRSQYAKQIATPAQTPVQEENVTSSPSSAMFWAGVALGGIGTVSSLVGGILAGTAYEEAEYVSHDNLVLPTFDEKKSKLNAGYALIGIGAAATITGVVLVIVDHFSQKSNDQTAAVTPMINLGAGNASAGIAVTF
jgi:hypothetical protein